MARHTAGRWEVMRLSNRHVNGADGREVGLYDGGPVIATVWPMGEDFNTPDRPERDANARLIATAPALFDALGQVLQYLNHCTETDNPINGDAMPILKARALLATVEG